MLQKRIGTHEQQRNHRSIRASCKWNTWHTQPHIGLIQLTAVIRSNISISQRCSHKMNRGGKSWSRDWVILNCTNSLVTSPYLRLKVAQTEHSLAAYNIRELRGEALVNHALTKFFSLHLHITNGGGIRSPKTEIIKAWSISSFLLQYSNNVQNILATTKNALICVICKSMYSLNAVVLCLRAEAF